jgi:hypothetical protein
MDFIIDFLRRHNQGDKKHGKRAQNLPPISHLKQNWLLLRYATFRGRLGAVRARLVAGLGGLQA